MRWSLGEAGAAADAYSAALALYPRAQSPAIGLLLVKPRAIQTDGERIGSDARFASSGPCRSVA
jgi:hypothetical protein